MKIENFIYKTMTTMIFTSTELIAALLTLNSGHIYKIPWLLLEFPDFPWLSKHIQILWISMTFPSVETLFNESAENNSAFIKII